jgi:hypothetical protein
MSDTAASYLVDCVLPHVPVRQRVLSFPHALRCGGQFLVEIQAVPLRKFR